MYDKPQVYKTLNKNVGDTLKAHGLSRRDANLLLQVELGIDLLQYLDLRDEPLGVLTVILEGKPLRHPRWLNFSDVQNHAIANARQLLPGYSSRTGWQNALQDYQQMPSQFRIYEYDPNEPEKILLDNITRLRPDPNRHDAYHICLNSGLPFKERNMSVAKPDQLYSFRAEGHEHPLKVKIAAKYIQGAQPDWFDSTQTRPRHPITISFDQLKEVAQYIDGRLGGNNWQNRLKPMRYYPLTDDKTNQSANEIHIDGLTHLAGLVSSGKSTLVKLQAGWLVYAYQQKLTAQPQRITLVVGDSATSIQIADEINQWFCDDPETDEPVAVPLLGRSTRFIHLKQLHQSQEYQTALQNGRIHWGERFLNPTCPLQALINIDEHVPLKPGSEPCKNLLASSHVNKDTQGGKGKKPGSEQKHLCPLASMCPSQQVYHDMVTAQVWITTPGAMGLGTLPTHLEKRPVRIGDIVYEQSDLVVFDEVDTIIEWFDRLYAGESKLVAGGDGILDKLDMAVTQHQTENRVAAPPTRRWINAQRSFHTPIGHAINLLAANPSLNKSLQRKYFTSYTLFYRLTRRLLGYKEFGDKLTKTAEREAECLMDIFQIVLREVDPLRIQVNPDLRKIPRLSTLSSYHTKKKTNIDALKRYDKGITAAAQQFMGIMQYTMHNGDSLQAPEVLIHFQNWITQLIPDVQTRLDKLNDRLETSTDFASYVYRKQNYPDTNIDILTLRLEFAANAALLDRHTRLVFYEWHNRPPAAVPGDHPYSRVPSGLLNILPLPPIGRTFGLYTVSGKDNEPEMLSSFGYTNNGRFYVQHFHELRQQLDGQRGPNVLAMSGTSFLPHSTRWHFGRPNGILKRVTSVDNNTASIQNALQDESCWFRYQPVYDTNNDPIFISGNTYKRSGISKMVAALVQDPTQNGGFLGEELLELNRLAVEKPDFWQDRHRLLLLANSYDQCKWAADQMRQLWPEKAERIYHLVRPSDGRNDSEYYEASTKLKRIDIEEFAQTDGEILIAPLQAIGRGFNILNSQYKAAFGAIYFLTRPMPHPFDITAIAQELNRRIDDWIADESFVAWTQADGLYESGIKVRQLGTQYWRKAENRYGYRRLYDEEDQKQWQENMPRLHANPRRDLAATTAGKIVQAIGRLLRGDVPFHAYFIDAAWAPNQAYRLRGDEKPRDTDETSLLVAICLILDEYVDYHPAGRELYEFISQKLQTTQHLDWDME